MDCGECTLCCKLFDVEELNKSSDELCIHCISGKGCSIWNTRPPVCRNFFCAYVQIDNAPIKLRPDHCGMIFEKLGNKLFYGLQDDTKVITDIALSQIHAFMYQGYSVLVHNHGRDTLYLAVGHIKEDVMKEFYKKVENRYGNSKLHN